MISIFCKKLPRILKAKSQLEQKLNIKISNNSTLVTIDGTAEDEYTAEKIINALNFGFPFSAALLIKEEGMEFEIIPIKEYTKTRNIERIRARIIGKNGRALKTLSHLTGCFFELNNNELGIISSLETIENAQNAVISLIRGAKHSNVYKILEHNRQKPINDWGIKKTKKPKSKL